MFDIALVEFLSVQPIYFVERTEYKQQNMLKEESNNLTCTQFWGSQYRRVKGIEKLQLPKILGMKQEK